MKKGTLKYIDSDTAVHEIFSTTNAELVSYDNNGTDTTVANFLNNLSFDTAETADVAEKAEKDLSGNVITSTYAPKNSPNFTGTPTAPTASDLDLLTNQVATVAWANNVFKRFTGIVPENMDTLQEFWDALGHDSDLATTLSTELAKKQDKTDKLTAFSNLTLSADKLILATGENSFSTTALTSTGKNIISSYTDKDIRKALGVYKNLIYDECENVWGVTGSPEVSNGQLSLDGTYYIGLKNPITLGASPFTAELFVNAPAASAYNTIFALFNNSNDRFRFCTCDDNSGKIRFLLASSAAGLSTEYVDSDPFINQKVHLAFSYDSSKIRVFFGGNLLKTWDATLADVSYPLAIGGNSGAYFLTGIVDEFRLSKTCRYTENFTPETRFEVDEYTISLLHFD